MARCDKPVSGSGGYWAGTCKRPSGHAGKHRKWATKADQKCTDVVIAPVESTEQVPK